MWVGNLWLGQAVMNVIGMLLVANANQQTPFLVPGRHKQAGSTDPCWRIQQSHLILWMDHCWIRWSGNQRWSVEPAPLVSTRNQKWSTFVHNNASHYAVSHCTALHIHHTTYNTAALHYTSHCTTLHSIILHHTVMCNVWYSLPLECASLTLVGMQHMETTTLRHSTYTTVLHCTTLHYITALHYTSHVPPQPSPMWPPQPIPAHHIPYTPHHHSLDGGIGSWEGAS